MKRVARWLVVGSYWGFCACSTAGGGGSSPPPHSDGGVHAPLDLASAFGDAAVVSVNPDAASPDQTPLTITKTDNYTGTQQDPLLGSTSDCPDEELEPNDDFADSVAVPIPVDGGSGWIVNQAVCPAGAHDIDYFLADTSGASAANVYLKVELTYDVAYGDLDVAIVAADHSIVAADGSAVNNACVTANVGKAKTYVGVVGANGDVNRYQIRIRAYSTPQTCAQ